MATTRPVERAGPAPTAGHGDRADASDGLVAEVAARLVPRFGDRVTGATIEDAVRAAYDELTTNARIRTFLPILTERVASARLLELLRVEDGAGS